MNFYTVGYIFFLVVQIGMKGDFFMQSMRKIAPQREHIKQWTDVFFSNGKDVGFVAVLNLEYKDKPSTRYYKQTDLHQLLVDTQGKKDRYISLNAFNRFSRKSEHVNQIRTIGIDVDQYKLGLTHDDVMREISYLVAENKIPQPNLVLKSRGVQIFYSINDGASVKMAWLQNYLTTQIIKLLENVGADPQANDLSRVMRIPYSINSRNNSIVEPEILFNQAYTLDELRAFFPSIKRYKKSNHTIKKNNVVSFNKSNLTSTYAKLNANRTSDIETLIQLRNGNLTGCRNTALYIYAFHASQSIKSLETMIEIARNAFKGVYSNDTSQTHTPENEFKRTVKSAYEDGKKFKEYLTRNGYRIFNKKNDGIIKPYKTHKVIDLLNISHTEQQSLRTLVNAELAYSRKKQRQQDKRRQQGIRPKADYLNQQTNEKEKRLIQLEELISIDPFISKTELASKLGLSRQTVYRYLKELKH